MWRDTAVKAQGQTHSAQVIVDSFNYLTETLSSVSAQPTSAISSWLADKIAPDYWRPNSEIIVSMMKQFCQLISSFIEFFAFD